MKMVSRFLLLMVLSCCVCGLELNVTHSFYQAEEKQNITLDWTFTPKPQTNLKYLFVSCYMLLEGIVSVLLDFQEGIEFSKFQSEEFLGRVHLDKDKLKEGKIRLHVSSLRTEDSGEYWCSVHLPLEEKSVSCRLNVTAARNQTHSTTEPHSGGPGETNLYCLMFLAMAAAPVGLIVVLLCLLVFNNSPLSKRTDREIDSEKPSSQILLDKHQLCSVSLGRIKKM